MAFKTSILSAGSNSYQTSAEQANGFSTDFITPGVVGTIVNTAGTSPQTGALSVNATGTTNVVTVSAGVGYVGVTPDNQGSQVLRITSDSVANVTIPANATGTTKFDYLYLKVDATLASNPNVNGDNVASLYLSRSSLNTIDNGTPPPYGTLLSIVTVNNNFSTIANGNITDKRIASGLASSNKANISQWYQYNDVVFPGNVWQSFKADGPNSDIASANQFDSLYPGITARVSGWYLVTATMVLIDSAAPLGRYDFLAGYATWSKGGVVPGSPNGFFWQRDQVTLPVGAHATTITFPLYMIAGVTALALFHYFGNGAAYRVGGKTSDLPGVSPRSDCSNFTITRIGS